MKELDNIPTILYKYRDWDNDFHKRSINHNEIYFASPNQFNDPFDANIPFRYDEKDLTDENIFLKYIEIGKRMHPKWNESQLHELAYNYQTRQLLFDEQHLEEQNFLMQKKFNSNFRIISTSKNKNNFLMWSHYSNSHKGFCLGYNSQKLFEQTTGQIGPVIYSGSFPKFGLFENHIQQSFKSTYFKSDIWEYEDEFRILKGEINERVKKLNQDTVEEIILGNKMPQKIKFEILEIAKKKYPNAKVFDTTLHKSKFELIINRIR